MEVIPIETSKDKGTRGLIFNIQRYSIHDGPGIRTTVFLKGCPLECFWCQNPESQRGTPEIFLNKEQCTLCGQCVAICPTGASSLLLERSTIDRGKCTGCGMCVDVCPSGARSLVGRYATVEEVVQEVVRDKKFYENSGGGVSLSGGDPTVQIEFALAILRGWKEEGLHTVLDTCGYASWLIMEKLLEFTDLVLYDIKCMDTTKHYGATGKPNDIILENAKKIAKCKLMRVRVPMIPGFNDTAEEVRAIAEFVKDELGAVDIDLLPYNKWAESKYDRLGKTCFHLEEQSEEDMERLRAIVSSVMMGEKG